MRLASGADTVDNTGAINGAVSLGAGDDIFIQRAGGSVSGLVDGGDGRDKVVVDGTGGTATLAAAQITGFERITQIGTGTGSYSGAFAVDTINLASGTLLVAAGQRLATTGTTTVIGLGGAPLTVVNNGVIAGDVRLGSGDDTYVEGVGSRALGVVDGGAGSNLYRVVLAGDRAGIGARTNFQNLAVDGAGTLSLTLDQSFKASR